MIEKLGYKEARGCSKYCLGVIYTGHVQETKRFKNTIKFIEKVNAPLKKVQEKTTAKLGTIKKAVISDIKTPRST